PGRDVLTLVPGGHYDFASGSSLATAEVSGILALMISHRRHLPAESAEQILTSSARDGAADGLPGLVNACRALVGARGRGFCASGRGSIAEDAKTRSLAR